ncbi:MAG TPA: exodeoxyribonuclease III [Tahibacter sp.]|uniref:exodeoxyribonuclease III n=1 Tax=Tahibacter sp. TaxID=2056211 RepID=UPI002C458153|nr:exodeoxyribonuclease III [Tahibacter sp.]HSX59629.1 exodeoxyribonuclease III [Tahibacter sp.]
MPARRKTLRIATYNVNGIRARGRHLLDWLAREAPDIVCLQELKAVDAAFPEAALAEAGYSAHWAGQSSWNGVAILARGHEPLEIRRRLPGSRTDRDSRYLEAAVRGIVVGCLYAPNGNPQPGPKFDAKLAWMRRFNAHAATLVAAPFPVVLAGDYNVVPTDFDIYRPDSWRRDALLQPESRELYARLLQQGWTDALRTLHPDEKLFTFWDYFRQHWQRDAGLRIDHLLTNAAVKLRHAGVDRWVRGEEKASDHAPAWIEIDVPPAAKRAAATAPAAPRRRPAPRRGAK